MDAEQSFLSRRDREPTPPLLLMRARHAASADRFPRALAAFSTAQEDCRGSSSCSRAGIVPAVAMTSCAGGR